MNTQTHTQARTHTNAHTHRHTHKGTHKCTHIRTHTNTRTCAHTHTFHRLMKDVFKSSNEFILFFKTVHLPVGFSISSVCKLDVTDTTFNILSPHLVSLRIKPAGIKRTVALVLKSDWVRSFRSNTAFEQRLYSGWNVCFPEVQLN